MLRDVRYAEDLTDLAAEAFRLAGEMCGPCRNFHALWPYLRLAEASGGNVHAPAVAAAIAQFAAGEGIKLLLAGAADTGLLSMVARTVGNHVPEIVVLDRCETPLELCRRFSRRWSLPIETLRADLQSLETDSRFDVVFAHSILQFIPADRRPEVLSRLRRALRPDGRMIIVFRTSDRIEDGLLSEYRESYATQLMEQLDRKHIALPEPREAFRLRVEIYSEERRAREGAHREPEEVENLIANAGFEIESITPTDARLSAPFRKFTAKISKQRFLVIARPK